MKIGDCLKCKQYITTELRYNFVLLEAIYSVAMASNKSIRQMQIIWMTGYHYEGHPNNYETGNYDSPRKDADNLSKDLDRIGSDTTKITEY